MARNGLGSSPIPDANIIRKLGLVSRLPQFGIFAQGTQAHHFVEFDLIPGTSSGRLVEGFRRLRAPTVSAGGANVVVGFSASVWRSTASWDAPESLRDFEGIAGANGRGVPATQHDAWLWISAGTPDVALDRARAAVNAVADVAVMAAERSGFLYHEGRDLTGFVDGTANPPPLRAPGVALVPSGAIGAGGSHVLFMRWVHDLEPFERLSVHDQEGVFGRSKAESVEMADAEKPANAHIARVQVDVDGSELEIFRRSVPYGGVAEHGLYFLAFSADRSRYDIMLARMFGTPGDPSHDRLTDFSRPVAAACYFAPSLTSLHEVAGPDPDE
jgi:putative iron-dependent peroxidase